MDEILEERRLVVTGVTSRKTLIDVALDVPVSVDITGVVRLNTSSLNLLETPLRQVDIASTKITPEIRVLQSECGSKGPDLCAIVRGRVTDNLNLPVILGVSNSGVT